MFSAISYLFRHFFYHIWEFLEHWYGRSLKMYTGWVIDRLEEIDYYIAFKETLRHFFEPLYRDYSLVGRFLGVIFRTLRILAGAVIYAVVFAVVIGLYVIWLLVLPYLIFRIIAG